MSDLIKNKTDCLDHSEYMWMNPNINFDNVFNAMVALFQVVSWMITLVSKQAVLELSDITIP